MTHQLTIPEGVRESVEGRMVRPEDDASKDPEQLPPTAGVSVQSRPEGSMDNEDVMQEGPRDLLEGSDMSMEAEGLPPMVVQLEQHNVGPLENNQESTQEGVREPVEGREVTTEDDL
jgi:hypothetical protein